MTKTKMSPASQVPSLEARPSAATVSPSTGSRIIALAALIGVSVLAGCSSLEESKKPVQIVAELEKDKDGNPLPESLKARGIKQVNKRMLVTLPRTDMIAFDYGKRGVVTSTALAAGASATNASAPNGAGANGAAGASGATGASGASGTSTAPEGAPKDGATPAPADGAAPAGDAPATGKEGAYRFRRAKDGAWVAAFYRKPLYREILFSPQGNGAGADGAAPPGLQPNERPRTGDVIEYLCPRCNRTVAENDPFCRDCGLAFSPEDKEAPRPTPTGAAEVIAGGATPTTTTGAAVAQVVPSPTGYQPPQQKYIYVCFVDGTVVADDVTSCPSCFERLDLPGRKIPIRVDDAGEGGTEKAVASSKEGTINVDPDNPSRATVVPDAGTLQDTIVETIREYKLFDSVVGSKDATLQTSLDAAKAKALAGDKDGGFDFLLVPTIRQWQISYLGTNGAWWGSLFSWVMVGEFPSLLIAGEDYKCEIVIDFALYHVRSGQKISDRVDVATDSVQRGWTDEIRGEITSQVDQYDRGWYPWSIVFAPAGDSFRRDAGWGFLDQKMAPLALNQIQTKLLKDQLYVQFGAKEWDEIDTKTPEIVSLLVGCGSLKNVPEKKLAQTSRDIEGMEKVYREKLNLSTEASGNRYSKLVDNNATRENVTTWLRATLPRLAPSDFFLFYFSGFGAIEEVAADDKSYSGNDRHEKFLILYDTDPSDLKRTAFPLSLLQSELAKAKVKYALVALDCSFAAEAKDMTMGLGRSFRHPATKVLSNLTPAQREDAYKNLTTFPLYDTLGLFAQRGAAYCQVLVAANQDQAAMEYTRLNQTGMGLFTYFLSRGIAGAADGDKDGRGKDGDVSINELDTYVKREVARIANVAYGLPQDVRIVGTQNMPYIFPLARIAASRDPKKGT